MKKQITILAIGSMIAGGASAKVTLPRFFTDNMVVQQNSVLTLPGTAEPMSQVTVRTDWSDDVVKTKAGKDGRFSVTLPTPAAGGPYTLIVSDGTGDDTVLSNVLSGEVWLCSGQSNMEYPVKGWTQVMNAGEVVATAQHPDIRLLQVRKNISYAPLDDAEVNMGGWVEASPATMDFSAIAYLYALHLHNELGVPVGVIDSTWGGTPAEAWTGYSHLLGVPGFEGELAALKNSGFTRDGLQADYDKRVNEWLKEVEKIDVQFDRGVYQTGAGWGMMPVPALWETSVLPDFDGVVWVQKKLELPAEAAGKPVELHLGIIDNEDVTYFNGQKVGGMNGWDAPRFYNVPGNLVKKDNVITIRVIDFDGGGGIGGRPEDVCAIVDGKAYPLAGDWNYLVAGDFRSLPQRPSAVGSSSYPTVLYNAMIHPLRIMPVKGVLWYQGCANVGRDKQYAPLFKALINDWRELWKKDFPFYFVQLSGFQTPKNVQPDSPWADLRNSQAKALELPNTGMAVSIDLGHPGDIHPSDKQEVARRLSLIALNRDYGKDCEYAAPVCVAATPADGKIQLKFNGAVKPTSSALTGFIIGDKDGNFAYANARLVGDDTVVLSSPLIKAPVVARYDWADYPGGNLYGANGLPVAPFATDK